MGELHRVKEGIDATTHHVFANSKGAVEEFFMKVSSNNMDQINKLVDELTKDRPNLHQVKTSMEKLGLEYSEDPVQRLNTVLMSLHPQLSEHEALKDL